MVDASPVTRSSLRRVLPIMAPRPMVALPARTWSGEQWERIGLGYRSRDMDEKWNVFVEDRVVFAHRSWTGRGVYEASFEPVTGGWRIAAGVVESDPSRHRSTSDDWERVMLELVLSAIVLGEPATELRAELVALTAQKAGRTDLEAGVFLHSNLGLRS
ncbi:hypothetical protein ACFO1B_45975 [Dactylosporangium siamense]|uniref:Uncharacterized protein n=1 Tax=Dactylosporangium siamense TaxID=685454 RepID=A0A919UBL2_9ACTN|nr:hypothetical protein [Dactylosporangium siamense]GIG45761.1 hypothetical protein Dsi01nite_038020 [Dactylosporangium siamense]